MIKNAELVRAPTSIAAVEQFKAEHLDAVAGVKNPLMAIAAKEPAYRVIPGNFMVIGQASGVPRGRDASAHYLYDFIEEMKRTGFVADALKRSGVTDAKAPSHFPGRDRTPRKGLSPLLGSVPLRGRTTGRGTSRRAPGGPRPCIHVSGAAGARASRSAHGEGEATSGHDIARLQSP